MRRMLSLLACLIAVGGSAVTGVSAHADVSDTDAAYCPYGFVNGVGVWSPPETTTLAPHTFQWNTQAQCLGGLDESGTYNITFVGTALDNCAAGNGTGSLSGSGPEGSIAGTFTFYRGGVHLYISGTFFSGGEQHSLQYWLDVLASAEGACNYSTAQLVGHGVIADSVTEATRAVA
jgi:hypothetical protein